MIFSSSQRIFFSCKFTSSSSERNKKAIFKEYESLTLGSVNLNSSLTGSLFSCWRCISRISALAELLMWADDGTFHSKGSFALRLELFI